MTDGRLLGPQAWAGVVVCRAPCGAQRTGSRCPRRARRARAHNPRDRRARRSQPGDRPSLAPRIRTEDRKGAERLARAVQCGRSRAAQLPASRNHQVRAPRRRQGLALPALPLGGRDAPAAAGEGDPRSGGGRQLRAVRLRPLHRRAGVPSPRSRHQALQPQRHGRGPVARPRSRRGSQVRAVVRQLPRRSRGGRSSGTLGPSMVPAAGRYPG